MPRPRLFAEADRIRAWTIAHPKIIVVPEKSPMPDWAKLVAGILASGGAMVFLASIYEYLTLAGVVDSMPAARIVLVLAGVAAFAGILVSELLWGKSRKAMIVAAITAAVALIVGLWNLDSWTVRYRVAHAQQPLTASEARDYSERPMTPQEQQIVGTLISEHLKEHPGERVPLDWMNQQLRLKKQNFQMRHMPPIADDVIVDGAGSTEVFVNGLVYMRNGEVSGGKVGIENNGGQVHLAGTKVHDNEKNIINNAQPKEAEETTKPHPQP
jgi:hypothetical protein